MIPTKPDDVFTPKVWILGHPGTNGYITSWGMMLSGTAPLSRRRSTPVLTLSRHA